MPFQDGFPVKRALLAAAATGIVVAAVAFVGVDRSAPPGPYLEVESVSETPSGATVTAYEQLSPAQQDAFDWALSNDDPVEVDETGSVDVWYETDFVRYDGELYRVLVAES